MDWKSITTKFDPFIAKLDPYIDKAKDAGYKALDFTQRQLQNTPVVLKTMDEFTLLRTSKRFVLIAYDESDPRSREILLRAPVWSTKAWSDAAELRFVEISSSPEIIRHLGISTPVDMYVWYIGTETFHSSDVEAIKNWWKTRCYDGKTDESEKDKKSDTPPSSEATNTDIKDPLAEK